MPTLPGSEVSEKSSDQADFDRLREITTSTQDDAPSYKVIKSGDKETDLGRGAITTGQGLVKGLTETAPTTFGAVAGAKIGLSIAPPHPVTKFIGGALGAAAGALAGYQAGQYLRSQLATVTIPGTNEKITVNNIYELPPEWRPYAVFGETMGGAAGMAPLPFYLHAAGIVFSAGLPGRLLNNIVDTAVKYPRSYLMAEIASGAGAGFGGAAAETFFPEQIGPRIIGETVGGFASPFRWTISGYRALKSLYGNISSGVSKAGRQSQAALVIERILQESGEEPMDVVKSIQDAQKRFPNLDLTAAQSAQSPALTAIEKELAAESIKFGAETAQRGEAALTSLKTAIGVLERSGDPSAFRQAAQLRHDYFVGLLSNKLQTVQTKALEALGTIDPKDTKSLKAAGIEVDQILGEALSSARKAERELWGKVDKTVEVPATQTLAAHDALKAQRLKDSPWIAEGKELVERARQLRKKPMLLGIVGLSEQEGKQVIAGLEKAEKKITPITVGELIKFRSRMLEQARISAAGSAWDDARVYGELAEAALDDLDAIGQARQIPDTSYDAARQFSKSLNDVWSRTYAGESQATKASGAPRIPPEVIMKRAITGGAEMSDLHFRQLTEAAQLAGSAHAARMLQLQEQTLRYAAAKSLDPRTKAMLRGEVDFQPKEIEALTKRNTASLRKFVEDNREVLAQFPELQAQLKSTTDSSYLLGRQYAINARVRREIENNAAFSKVLEGADPTFAISAALKPANPNKQRDITKLINVAERGGQQAKDGFLSSVFALAYDNAVKRGDFSFTDFRAFFQQPLDKTYKISLLQLLKARGLTHPDVVDNLESLLDRAVHIEMTMKAARSIDPDSLGVGQDMAADFVARVVGSGVATKISQVTPGKAGAGHGLQVAGAGARVGRAVVNKIPQARVKDALIEAAKNPEVMKTLLTQAKTQKEKIRLGRQLNAFFYQMGITMRPGEGGQTPVPDEYQEEPSYRVIR